MKRDFCGIPLEYNIPFNSTEIETPDLLYGLINFDNILYSSLVIFVCMVIDGWTRITYIVKHHFYELKLFKSTWMDIMLE